MVKYKKNKDNSKSKLYGGGNTCSLKRPKQINYNLRPSTDNFCLYATPYMKIVLQDIYDNVMNSSGSGAAYQKKVCGLLEKYIEAIVSRAIGLLNPTDEYSEDFELRHPDFDRDNDRHQTWLIESLMPGEIRALIAMRGWCGKLIKY
jgi:hypothetical protein